jgi:uncharacterized protein with ParB-like and HNH nuclease domain
MSFGELMNMYDDGDLFITPEYQRVFRWSDFQQSRFIESVLLGIPIPPIFVAEDGNGKWEVVDGLQRISTIFSFFGILKNLPDKNNSILTQGELVKELEGITINTMPIKLRSTIKRAVCRVEIVKWDSIEDMRYELFNRLNTGASPLSDQEIRNCIFRSYKVDFNKVLRDVASLVGFCDLISPTDTKKEQMYLEELVLRFFAFGDLREDFKTTVPQFLSDFMRSVSKGEKHFDLEKNEKYLIDFIELIGSRRGKVVFRPNGVFAMHLFDSIAYSMTKVFPEIQGNEEKILSAIDNILIDDKYNSIGTSSFSNTRIKARMERALEVFLNVQQPN